MQKISGHGVNFRITSNFRTTPRRGTISSRSTI